MELMMVIAIIGVLSATSIPLMFNPENKVRRVARELIGDMQRTRMNAIRSNQDWAIVFIPGNNEYRICSGPGPDNAWSNVGDNPTRKTVAFDAIATGVTFGGGTAAFDATVVSGGLPGDGVSYGSNVLTFNTRGTCSSGFTYVSYNNASYAVGTLSSGNIRIRRWNNGGWR